jgi:hypothetical protein
MSSLHMKFYEGLLKYVNMAVARNSEVIFSKYAVLYCATYTRYNVLSSFFFIALSEFPIKLFTQS